MARTWDEKNKDLQIKERETAAYQAGKEAGANEALQIGEGTQARLTSKQKREAFDKFVIDWRKQNSLEGTDVMPPTEVVPLWMRRAEGKNEGMTIAGNPSFDINETPATRRTRKIRTLQERGVGGEAGNASDILKKGLQLPQIKAELNPNQLKILKEIPSNLNEKPSKERLKIMKDITGRVLKAQGGRGHTTVGDKLYLDPIKQKLMPLPIDTESDKDKQIRHNKRFNFA